ncbi:MAG: TonB family protein [Bacteroidaceae bacterium]|nr:TonB family protein [Bacteroidaceae bacterium]
MLTFFLYLMKSVLCLALFYPFYMVLLSRETFHRFNRMALISILVASVVIPACRITTEEPLLLTQLYQRWENWLTGQDTETVAVAYVDWAEMEMTAMPITEEEVLTPASTFSLLDFLSTHWSDLLFMLYVGGILFLLGRHVVSIFRLFALLRQGKLQRLDDGTRLYLHNRSDIAPFSWMKYIVISEADYRENGRQIVAHEQAHISNGHSWDLLLVEVCLLAQWFNPAAWLIRQELQNIHEYGADDTVLRRGINAKEYQLLIIKKAVGARLYSLANSLNHSSLKKRLTMMMKRKSNPWARLKYLYVLPLAAISMVAFAHTEAANNSNGISEAKGTEVLANEQTSSVNSSENRKEKILIVVDGKLSILETTAIDCTSEDLAKHIGVTPEEIAQIDVIKKPETLAQWNIPGATGAILITTKKAKATDENPVVVVHVNDKGEYSYGYKGETMEEASLERITNFIEAVQLDRIDKQKEGPLLRVSLSVDKNAPAESVEKLKVAIRESHISKLEYNMASEQKEALIDYLKLNGQPRLNEESNAIEWGSAEEVFMVVENMPEFPGGTAELMKFLAQNIKYPVEAQKENVQGRVVVQFVVSKTGKITDPTIARSVSPELDAEAIRVVKAMPNWKPGTQRGQAVNVKFNIPISFRLDGAKGNEGEEESDIRVVGYNKENIKAVYSEPREEVSASTSDDEVFQVVENMPEFPGGTEELIKKLPGAQMGENGKITINGKEVKKISMNGKDFYDGDQVVNTNKSMQTKVTAEGSVKDNNEIFEIVENMPEFPGGMAELMKFLQQNIKYPEQAQKDSIQGRVIVQFTIKKTGEVSSTTVVRSVSPELDAEAIRVVNAMPLWTPGEQKGEPVNVKFTLPIQFRLTDNKK